MLRVAVGRWRPKIVWALIAAVLIAACVMGYLYDVRTEDKAVQDRIARIHQLIPLGMDIDKAAYKLQKEGFRTEEKFCPFGEKTRPPGSEYYFLYVRVREDLPFYELIQYAMGGTGERRLRVTLIADITGRIIEVR